MFDAPTSFTLPSEQSTGAVQTAWSITSLETPTLSPCYLHAVFIIDARCSPCPNGQNSSPDKEDSMSKAEIIRAWKDPLYRRGLSNAELAALPENPAGRVELTDAELDNSEM